MGQIQHLAYACTWTLRLLLATFVVSSVWMVSADSSSQHMAQVKVNFTATAGDSSTKTSHTFRGTYGYNSRRTFVSGHLIHVHSEGGLNHGCTNYTHPLPQHDWVALIERGECMFTQKLKLATQNNNASAAIVYNNQDAGATPFRIHSSVDSTVYIFLEQDDGRRLADLVDSGGHVHVDISPLPDASSAAFSVPLTLTLLALLVIIGRVRLH